MPCGGCCATRGSQTYRRSSLPATSRRSPSRTSPQHNPRRSTDLSASTQTAGRGHAALPCCASRPGGAWGVPSSEANAQLSRTRHPLLGYQRWQAPIILESSHALNGNDSVDPRAQPCNSYALSKQRCPGDLTSVILSINILVRQYRRRYLCPMGTARPPRVA